MAKEKKAARISPAALKALDRLNKSTDRLIAVQNDVGKGVIADMEKNSKIADDLGKLVTSVYNGFVGVGQADYGAQEVNQILTLSQKNASRKKSDVQKQMADFKKSVSGSNKALELVRNRQETKSSMYRTYDMIIEIIPKMRMAIKTIVNAIISPDDFNKKSIGFDFKTSSSSDRDQMIRERIKEILDDHDLEKDLPEVVRDVMVKGEYFWAILSLNDEIRRALKEDAASKNDGYDTMERSFSVLLAESVNRPEERELLSEGLAVFNEGVKKGQALSEEKLVEDLQEFFSDRVVVGEGRHLLSETEETRGELQASKRFSSAFAMERKKDNDADIDAIDGMKLGDDSVIVKKLPPENVVKLEYDGRVYGYIVVDAIPYEGGKRDGQPGSNGQTTQNPSTNSVVGAINAVVHTSSDMDSSILGGGGDAQKAAAMADPKLRFIADVFVNRLSRQENIRLIRKNQAIKDAVYSTLITRRITRDEKLRVLFLTPDEVVHIDRKESIFDNVLFFAKLYIATLITILMQNIVRGADKRAYMIEVGLENDAANAVNSVIRDIKAKDVTNVHNMDLSSMMNVLGINEVAQDKSS